MHFMRNNMRLVTPITKILSDLESRRQEFKTSCYTTMFDKLYCQGHFKVIASFDLGDLMTLKHSMFLLAIQGLPCTAIATFYL